MKQYKNNDKKYKVLTDDGYKEFSGIAYMGDKQILKVMFDDDSWIKCSERHRFFTHDMKEILACDIKNGTLLYSISNHKCVTDVLYESIEATYDLIDVDGHKYFTDNILSHNCQFISFEETLIDGVVLKGLRGIEPVRTAGRVRWYGEILPNRMYIAGLDPSIGTGGDNSAITVWRVPDMVQVAEWKHNKSDTKEQIRVLIDILVDIHRELRGNPEQQGKPEIYWSVENNTIGEAALQIIEATGEDKFPGEFVHEPKKKRKGFTTTQKNKIEACIRLKHLVEHKKLIVKSLPMIMELKSFVKNNRSFAAKVGQTDDIVSSSLLCMRILTEVQNWDASTYDELADIINIDEEGIDPMPGIFV